MLLTNWPSAGKIHLAMSIMTVLIIGQAVHCKKEKEKKTCGVQVVAIEQIKYKAVPVEVVEQPDPYLMKMMTGGGKGGTTMVTNPSPTPDPSPPPASMSMYPAATTTSAPPSEVMDQMMKMMIKYTANVAKTAAQAVQGPMSPPAMQQMGQGMVGVPAPMVEIPMAPPMPPPLPMMKGTNSMYPRPPQTMRPQFYSNRRPGMPPPTPAPTTTTTTTTTPAPQKAPSVYLLPVPAAPMMPGMSPAMIPPVAGMTPTSKDMSAPPMHMTPNGPLPMMSNSMSSYTPQNAFAANLLKTLNQIVIPQQLELIPLEIPTTTTTTSTPAPPSEAVEEEGEMDLDEDEEEEGPDPKGPGRVRLDSEAGGSPKVNPNIQKNFVDEDETFGRHKSRHRPRSRPFSSSKLANAGLEPGEDEEPESVDLESIKPNKNVGVRIMDPNVAQQYFSRSRHPPKAPSFAEMLVSRGNSLFQSSDISSKMIDPSLSKSPKRRNWHSVLSSPAPPADGASGKVNNSTLISSSSEQSIISKIKGSLTRLVMARSSVDTAQPGPPPKQPTVESLTTLGASGIQVIDL